MQFRDCRNNKINPYEYPIKIPRLLRFTGPIYVKPETTSYILNLILL